MSSIPEKLPPPPPPLTLHTLASPTTFVLTSSTSNRALVLAPLSIVYGIAVEADFVDLQSYGRKGDVDESEKNGKGVPCWGSLGLIELEGDVFLTIITSTELARHLTTFSGPGTEPIHRVLDVEFHSLTSPLLSPFPKTSKHHPAHGVHKLLSSGSFYFSPPTLLGQYDITSRLSLQITREVDLARSVDPEEGPTETAFFELSDTVLTNPHNTRHTSSDLICDPDFMFNLHLLTPLLNFRQKLAKGDARAEFDRGGFAVVAIQGYVGCCEVDVKGEKTVLSVVSRLCWRRTGTRFKCRGADHQGYVANFAEMETTLRTEKECYSSIAIRGSVPLLWTESPGHKSVTLAIDTAHSYLPFTAHFTLLTSSYNAIHAICCLSSSHTGKRGAEGILATAYYDFLQQSEKLAPEDVVSKGVSWEEFDLNQVKKDEGIEKVPERTNVVSALLSTFALDDYIKDVGMLDQFKGSGLEDAHRVLFSENGDALSVIYCGTGAMDSIFTRTGKDSPKDKVLNGQKWEKRIVQWKYKDGPKEEAIDKLVGKSALDGVTGQMRQRFAVPIQYGRDFAAASSTTPSFASIQQQPPPPPQQHTTVTRPLPPLPAHLKNYDQSTPTSPETSAQALSSGGSTPTAGASPRIGGAAAGGGTDASKKRDRGEGSSRGLSPGAGTGNGAATVKEDEDELEPARKKNAKKVKVGARASIACSTCRKRKVRCTSEWPSCTFCSGRNLTCVYEGHPAEFGGTVPGAANSLTNFLPMATVDPILPPVSIILQALDPFFLHNYDTFYFLHRPSLTESIKDGTVAKELVCCILAFAGRFCQPLQELHPSSPTAASEHYAALAAQVLNNPSSTSTSSSNPPPSTSATSSDPEISLVRCQCLLILGLYEVTECQENRGWMRLGSAIRMAQVLRLGFLDEEDNWSPSKPSRFDPVLAESRRRTFWSSFLLERTLMDGKERPCSLRAPHSSVLRMPGADADFNLSRKTKGAKLETQLPPWLISSKASSSDELEADLYGQTLRIAEIWSSVVEYIGSGGRNFDRRAPWLADSTFATLDREIKTWAARLPMVYRFNDANLIAHSMIGQGRLFGMLHLLHGCSALVLHRDYLPFLPPLDFQVKNGPTDGEPLFGDPVPPPGWWEDSVNVAIQASTMISDLSTSLSQHGSQITHPFAGFAVVAAATMHAHLKYWPNSCPKHIDGSFYFSQDVATLNALRDIYPMANNWCDGIAKLNVLYSNVVRGIVMDSDPRKIRSGVIKLLRTARDMEAETTAAVSAASPKEGSVKSVAESVPSNGDSNANPASTQAEPTTESTTLFDINQFDTSDLNLDSQYPLDLSALDMGDWSGWGDFGASWMNFGSVGGTGTDQYWPV